MPAILLCLAIAIHDVDGPIRCQTGEKIRLQGIGATEMSGACDPKQPCVVGDPFDQRRRMAAALGAEIDREDRLKDGTINRNGQLWLKNPIRLRCEITGSSYKRLNAWCRLPDGRDVSCIAISAGVAARWPQYDSRNRLKGCAKSAIHSRRL